jgi:hypothetical protein
MSKTRRRYIKKRITRRKKSRLVYKNKTRTAGGVYTNRNKSKQRKTKHRRSQRGGGIKFIGIDKETGKHIYWSTILNEFIQVAPLPSASKKVTYDENAATEKFIRELPDAGIVDAKGLAFVRDIKALEMKKQVRALPSPARKSLPQSFLEEQDKIFTKSHAEFIERKKLEDELAKYEPAMFADVTDSKNPKKTPSYLMLTDEELGELRESPGKKSIGAVAVASAAKLPGLPGKRLTYSDFGLETPPDSDSDLNSDSDIGHSPVPKPPKLDVLVKPSPKLSPKLSVKSDVKPHSATGLLQQYGKLQQQHKELLDENISRRLDAQLTRFKITTQNRDLIKSMKPCLQAYFLYRLEGRESGQTGISIQDIEVLNTELEDCPDLRNLLTTKNMFPLAEPLWVPDTQCLKSAIGSETFGVLNRRHHCRCCGRCVTKEYMVEGTSPKVCTECAKILK